jgi:hypothetical protein
MIINEQVSSTVVSNVLTAPTRFKIKASAKAFKILSGFYSEPILAIPRELGANAWDSHVKSGNTKTMFEVHAPNTLEPWFAIRDFGTGLSPEAIDTIYTTYFESTKTSDNDSDGCMGLGSKTPFNYTENFTVTSWHGGKKHVYNCFIDEAGSPNIMHLATQDSHEHTGLEVKFGVKIADIGMWVDKITRAYEPFRYRPSIKGAKIEYKPREYIYQGKKWAMRKSDGGYYNRGCNAFMGNYCYPVNSQAIRSAIYNSAKDDAYKLEQALSYGNFDFFFDIGDLDVAPNKEQLQYGDDNQTARAIIEAVKTAIVDLKDMVYKNIETPKSRWEAMYLYSKYNGYNSQYGHIRNIIGDIAINFDNNRVTNGSENVHSVHKATNIIDANSNIASTFVVYHLDSVSGRFKRTGNYHPHSDTRPVHIFYTNNMSIKSARLRHHLRTKYATGVFPSCFIITDSSKNNENFFKHMKFFGWDNSIVTDIDNLPKPPATPRQKKVAGTDEIYYSNISEFIKPTQKHYNGPYVSWGRKAATFDSTSTYYYVDFYYSDPTWNEKDISSHMTEMVKAIVDAKLINDTVIYGINVKNKGLLKVGKWINVVDLAKKAILANKEKHEQQLYKINQYEQFTNLGNVYNKLNRHPSIVSNIKNENTRKMFQTFMKVYSELTANSGSFPTALVTLFGITAKKHTELDIDPVAFKKTLVEKYLGIFDIEGDYYSSQCAAFYKIINFIDEKS